MKKRPTPHKAASSAPDTAKFTAMARLLALVDAINTAVLRAWCASPSGWGRGTIRAKAKAPVRSNTFSEAVAIPTEKRDFVSSKFLGLVRLHWPRMVLGGMGLPARMAARLRTCLKHPAHPTRVQTQTVALVTPEGAKTMTATTTASASAAPAFLPTTGNTTTTSCTSEAQAFALLQATSDATMARLYLQKGNIPAARRKAVQLLKALQALEGVASENGKNRTLRDARCQVVAIDRASMASTNSENGSTLTVLPLWSDVQLGHTSA